MAEGSRYLFPAWAGKGTWNLRQPWSRAQARRQAEFPEGLPLDLRHASGVQRKIEAIEGTKLFAELEAWLSGAESQLTVTDEMKRLAAEAKTLRLLERMAKLELSSADWNQVRDLGTHYLIGLGQLSNVSLNLWKKMETHRKFYESAEARDRVFQERVAELMKKEKTPVSALVAGGFHAQALMESFRKQGISYALVMPAIKEMPKETDSAGSPQAHYREHMRGEVSWKSYFEIENGRVSMYQAFMRAVRDKLISEYGSNGVSEKNLLPRYPDTPTHRYIIKAWRDAILRHLAATNQLDRAWSYTRFLDEVSKQSGDQSYHALWMANIERFIEGLRGLKASGRITPDNIVGLIPSLPRSPQASKPARPPEGGQAGAVGSTNADWSYAILDSSGAMPLYEEELFKQDNEIFNGNLSAAQNRTQGTGLDRLGTMDRDNRSAAEIHLVAKNGVTAGLTHHNEAGFLEGADNAGTWNLWQMAHQAAMSVMMTLRLARVRLSSSMDQRYNLSAFLRFAIASLRLSPWLTQPGSSGIYALNPPAVSFSNTTLYFMMYPPLIGNILAKFNTKTAGRQIRPSRFQARQRKEGRRWRVEGIGKDNSEVDSENFLRPSTFPLPPRKIIARAEARGYEAKDLRHRIVIGDEEILIDEMFLQWQVNIVQSALHRIHQEIRKPAAAIKEFAENHLRREVNLSGRKDGFKKLIFFKLRLIDGGWLRPAMALLYLTFIFGPFAAGLINPQMDLKHGLFYAGFSTLLSALLFHYIFAPLPINEASVFKLGYDSGFIDAFEYDKLVTSLHSSANDNSFRSEVHKFIDPGSSVLGNRRAEARTLFLAEKQKEKSQSPTLDSRREMRGRTARRRASSIASTFTLREPIPSLTSSMPSHKPATRSETRLNSDWNLSMSIPTSVGVNDFPLGMGRNLSGFSPRVSINYKNIHNGKNTYGNRAEAREGKIGSLKLEVRSENRELSPSSSPNSEAAYRMTIFWIP